MDIKGKMVEVITVTLDLEEAHQLAMALDSYMLFEKKRSKKAVAKVVSDLFEYFDRRLL